MEAFFIVFVVRKFIKKTVFVKENETTTSWTDNKKQSCEENFLLQNWIKVL